MPAEDDGRPGAWREAAAACTPAEAAAALADSLRRKGETSVIVMLTDGRGNIDRLGQPGRAQAEADALQAARQALAQIRTATTAQAAEQLLEVGQRDLLTGADGGQRHRACALAQRQIDHRSNGKTAFCCESHNSFLVVSSVETLASRENAGSYRVIKSSIAEVELISRVISRKVPDTVDFIPDCFKKIPVSLIINLVVLYGFSN